MKLYIYQHCPFCARVRYVAGMLNIPLEIINLAYDDDTTTNDLIGAKQVPLLLKNDGQALAESLDIIAYFIKLAQSSECHQPSESVLDWQRSAFLPLQKIGYPRWSNMDLPEFATQSAQQAWRTKKETDALNFDALLQDTPNIAKEVEALIERAKSVLNLDSYQHVTLVDEAILFSILRGFFSAAEIQWDNTVKDWMESVSNKTQVPLLR
ncbi:GrxB family glutaredoxin [Vibrio vulnificus]|uniref:GrxB family glutaredoxin n=1 Tax=Vibrio vulnificus TaxID=672 RepID=UPI001A2952A4|nr:GrxB family glutaredoxin [Vibrio vulnificus]EGR0098634.1 glutaredoxin, GrxB family [Vibrio vulnificus]EGR0231608.1 glutaredoxin, GrxB family [Vibrio vulnificus]ELM6615672.1 GrxB family glutaredoxin [Vibrio vulnificus]ELP3502191.1 GrxB family glutaredoxin [Vibrio vulnificus]ELP3550991.1 GrxB family glutaredoxin [Vibrio vulnificus]